MSRPVSWLVVERGWAVVASDGTEVGRVDEVLGDSTNDIFNGIAVATGFLSSKYVPAERVRAISEGQVELDLSAEEVDSLAEHQP